MKTLCRKAVVGLIAALFIAGCGTPSGVPATIEDFDVLRTQQFSVEVDRPIDQVYDDLEKQVSSCLVRSRIMPMPGPVYLGEWYLVPREVKLETKYQLVLAYRGDRRYLAMRVRLASLGASKTRVDVAARLPAVPDRERVIPEWANGSVKCAGLF